MQMKALQELYIDRMLGLGNNIIYHNVYDKMYQYYYCDNIVGMTCGTWCTMRV